MTLKYDEIRETHLRDTLKGVGDNSVYLWVSKNGDDANGTGSFNAPYATVTKAMAMVTTTRKTIMLMPGEYSEAAITWSDVNGVKLIGAFAPSMIYLTTAATTPVITIHPAVASANWEATLENIELESDFNAGVCLRVDSTHLTKKMLVYLNNVQLSAKNVTDSSLVVVNAGSSSIKLYATGTYQTWEGLVDFTAKHIDDRLRIYGYRIIGTVTMNEDIVAELSLNNVGLPADPTVHASTRYSLINCWHEDDGNPNTYTEQLNVYSQ
jgi:hypothetical protein